MAGEARNLETMTPSGAGGPSLLDNLPPSGGEKTYTDTMTSGGQPVGGAPAAEGGAGAVAAAEQGAAAPPVAPQQPQQPVAPGVTPIDQTPGEQIRNGAMRYFEELAKTYPQVADVIKNATNGFDVRENNVFMVDSSSTVLEDRTCMKLGEAQTAPEQPPAEEPQPTPEPTVPEAPLPQEEPQPAPEVAAAQQPQSPPEAEEALSDGTYPVLSKYNLYAGTDNVTHMDNMYWLSDGRTRAPSFITTARELMSKGYAPRNSTAENKKSGTMETILNTPAPGKNNNGSVYYSTTKPGSIGLVMNQKYEMMRQEGAPQQGAQVATAPVPSDKNLKKSVKRKISPINSLLAHGRFRDEDDD